MGRRYDESYIKLCSYFDITLGKDGDGNRRSGEVCNKCSYYLLIMMIYNNNKTLDMLQVYTNPPTGRKKKERAIKLLHGYASVPKCFQDKARTMSVLDPIPTDPYETDEELLDWCDYPASPGTSSSRRRKLPESYQAKIGKLKEVVVKKGLVGYGLFLTEDVKAGETIIEYTGKIIKECEVDAASDAYKKFGLSRDYMLSLENGYTIDSTSGGSAARFANHSCEPNSEFTEYEDEDGNVYCFIDALIDIPRFTEVLVDYKFPIDKDPSKRELCKCGARSCRKFLH